MPRLSSNNPLYTKDAQLGAVAVKKAVRVLRSHGLMVTPVREKGHDLLVGAPPEPRLKVEVKFDVVMDHSGNLAAEIWSDVKTKKPGWFRYSDADVLVDFHDMDNAYVLDMRLFREWVETELKANRSRFETKRTPKSGAANLLVPCEQLPESVRFRDWESWFTTRDDLSRADLRVIRGGEYPGHVPKDSSATRQTRLDVAGDRSSG